jgi:Domain of unknown function (DUF4440)
MRTVLRIAAEVCMTMPQYEESLRQRDALRQELTDHQENYFNPPDPAAGAGKGANGVRCGQHLRQRMPGAQRQTRQGEEAMFTRMVIAAVLALCTVDGTASAAEWSAEQQEIWKVEQQQWQLSAAEDMSWIDTMVHPNMRFWETGAPMPRDKASLKHWSRFDADNGSTLEQELFPISATITGNIAVVQYNYMIARENYKKERVTATGHYTDVLVKEGGRWLFLTWAGGDDPKK